MCWNEKSPAQCLQLFTVDSHLGHGVGGRSFVQKQECHLLVIVMCRDMERGEAVLEGMDGECTWIKQQLVPHQAINITHAHTERELIGSVKGDKTAG